MSDLKVSALIEVLDRFTEPAKRIAQVSQKVSSALTRDQAAYRKLADQAAYRKLADQAGRIGGLQRLEGQLAQTGQQLGTARERVAALARELRRSPTKQAARDFEQAQQQVRELAQAHGRLRTKVRGAREELRGAGVDTRALGAAGREAGSGLAALQRRMERVAAAAAEMDRAAQSRDAVLQRAANLNLMVSLPPFHPRVNVVGFPP